MERGLGILFSFLAQVCFFKEVPNELDVAGSAVITVTILFVSIRRLVDVKAESDGVRRAVCLSKWDPAESRPLVVEESKESTIQCLSNSTERALQSF